MEILTNKETVTTNDNEVLFQTDVTSKSTNSVVWIDVLTNAVGWNVEGNFRPLMRDVMENLSETLPDFIVEATNAAREKKDAAFFAAYREAQPAQPSEEELFEMRAAFGPGETVVDIVTGRTVTL